MRFCVSYIKQHFILNLNKELKMKHQRTAAERSEKTYFKFFSLVVSLIEKYQQLTELIFLEITFF